MQSVLEILKKTTDYLASKGVDNARFNSEVILGHALGLKRMQLYLQFERLLSEQELERVRPLVRRRAAREPLSHVLGYTDFYGLQIACDRRALIPRPETEELVELVLRRLAHKAAPLRVLDLGCGTGCIALALARELCNAGVTAVDASADALALATQNATATGLAGRLRLLRSDWYSALEPAERFDVIVSNPPYLTERETAEAMPEVREHEPHSALIASREGTADLRVIIGGAASRLVPGGLLALETGVAQHATLLPLLQAAGFPDAQSLKDLSGRERFLVGTLTVQ